MLKYIRSYLKIEWLHDGKDIKKKIDTFYPLAISGLVFCIYLIVFFKFNIDIELIFRSESFASLMNLFFALPGFYIAALAACLTINNPYFIYVNAKNNLKGVIAGDRVHIPIRTLFTTAFSYLTYLSFLLLLLYYVSDYFYENQFFKVTNNIYYILKNIFNSLIIFIFLRIIFVTLACVAYLGDRAQR
ncbi:hypothetical protein [Acinetobacter sp. 18QD2AZ41W]|jgi:hypothetical protein|uniref:hypothetical protein n=1 Tax=Acinetobacter sp. 18QD2AZ41W TaxID=2692137 RepID=UPI00135ACE4B|nr:hypothetical protein [Acinetobacter sp. 18QD2AZ41W]